MPKNQYTINMLNNVNILLTTTINTRHKIDFLKPPNFATTEIKRYTVSSETK